MPRRPRNTELLVAFGDRVRENRLAAGITQERLSELAHIHRTYAGHVERGTVTPTLDTIVRLAAALNINPAVLVDGLQPD